MDSLRCGTCLVQFNKRELHREHFKSDWHLYNIKRKVTPIIKANQYYKIFLYLKNCKGYQTGADYC